MALLRVENLTKRFAARHSIFGGGCSRTVVEEVSLEIRAGECLALVGETGSGKSTLGKCLVRLLRADAGSIVYDGRDLCRLSEKEFRPLRQKFQMIFQNPAQALNPRQSVADCLAEVMKVHRRCSNGELPHRVNELLVLVGLNESFAGRLPHELSGGQRQRVAIARSLAAEPVFVVADEPTSSLDAAIKRQILDLLQDLRQRLGLTVLLISHDLAAVGSIADRIAVMQHGRLVEVAPTESLLRAPSHPYTRLLLESARRNFKVGGENVTVIDEPGVTCRIVREDQVAEDRDSKFVAGD